MLHSRLFRNFCLDCQACETACPAGVRYGEIVEEGRALISHRGLEPVAVRLKKKLLLGGVWRSRRVFGFAGGILRLFNSSGLRDAVEKSGLPDLFPGRGPRFFGMLPRTTSSPFDESVPAMLEPPRPTGETVGLLAGCVFPMKLGDKQLSRLRKLRHPRKRGESFDSLGFRSIDCI